MNNNVIISCPVTGSGDTAKKHPNLPITPKQIAEAAIEAQVGSEAGRLFSNLLFSKIMPNLKKIGLLNDEVSEKYEEMGILEFKDLDDATVTDWDEMSKPLEYAYKTA